MRWLKRTDKKEFTPLVIEVDNAEQANRLINEGIVMGYDLKMVERYDASCRITQCFKCQKYGHISSVCANTEICGHCSGSHSTGTCAGILPAPRKRCAACHKGEHASWSAECPARVKEISRAKTARRTLPRLFPTSAIPPTLREAFGTPEDGTPEESTRLSGGSQATEGWSTVATKKRKLAGRPLGAVSKAKTINRDASQSIFSFTSQPQSTRGASEAPTIIQPIEHSQMDRESTSAIGEA
jgi:hypothetical protein